MANIPFGNWVLPDHRRAHLCWHRISGELVLHHPNGRRHDILAVIADETDIRSRLDGWEHHAFTSNGLAWLTTQLDGSR